LQPFAKLPKCGDPLRNQLLALVNFPQAVVADMVQAALDHVGANAEFAHERGAGPPQIVRAPFAAGQIQRSGFLAAPLESLFSLPVVVLLLEGLGRDVILAGRVGEQPLAVVGHCPDALELSGGEGRKVDQMLASILRVLGGDAPGAGAQVCIRPACLADFADAAAGGEHDPDRGLRMPRKPDSDSSLTASSLSSSSVR